jgi:membrane protein involved in colicin uptake
MSDATTETTGTETSENEQTQQEQEQKPTETVDFWKQKAREQEKRAKANADAAKRLADIEASQKSEADKAADRLAEAEKRATEAEAKALRREVALAHGLSKEDAELLDDLTDEEAMRRLAGRLAAANEDKRKQGNHVPNEGGKGGEPPALNSNALEDALKSKLGIT